MEEVQEKAHRVNLNYSFDVPAGHEILDVVKVRQIRDAFMTWVDQGYMLSLLAAFCKQNSQALQRAALERKLQELEKERQRAEESLQSLSVD